MKPNNYKYFVKSCIALAALSNAKKRKVGSIVVCDGQIIGSGYNHASDGGPCEYENKTREEVIHAEVAAITNAKKVKENLENCELYVTHEPCVNCATVIVKEKISEVHIVGNFLKFDVNKLRYDLIPPEATKVLAEVLTYGAKKYKPRNWQKCEDTDRYIAALMRHLEAHRSGELLDSESGMLHMSHVLTNAAFMVYFLTNLENINEENSYTSE